MVCGFDMLRCDNGRTSQVIDVNGWSFVKGNESYYGQRLFSPPSSSSSDSMSCLPPQLDKVAEILASLCFQVSVSPERPLPAAEATVEDTPTWLLKANVTVFRHADRTPKQKLKFNFPIGEHWTQPFVTLLNGEREEIILRERAQLTRIATAVEEAKGLGADGEDLAKLSQLSNALFSKIELPGTKAQLKPVYSKKQAGEVRRLTKLTLVFKWGGEVRETDLTRGFSVAHTIGQFTHSARYQSRDLGENMKKDISIMSVYSFACSGVGN
jgi:inositol-hexakisphosphate/diphosphoinositol-pentakisphosphate 1-kinase